MESATPTFRQSLEGSYLQGYRISALLMGLFFLILLPWRIGWMRSTASSPLLIWEAIALAATCFALAAFAPRVKLLMGHVENLGLGLVALGLVNNVSLLVLTHDPDQAANFMLLLVVSGFAFLTRWRFLFVQSLCLLFWALGTSALVGLNPFLNWLFPVIAAAMLGLLLHLFTHRVFKTLKVLRNRDQILLHQRARLITELRSALENVKILRGLIPICAQCKKVRNDGGYWQQVESYLHEHSEAEFTHGLCPRCTSSLEDEFDRLVPGGENPQPD